MKKGLNEILANHTGQPFDTVARDAERDKYFDAEEAKAYGLVDEVLQHPPAEMNRSAFS
jgi:ATP-dependent Clp protease protease subunit